MVSAAAAAVVGVWLGSVVAAACVAGLAWAGTRSVVVAACCLCLGCLGVVAAERAWAQAVPRSLGPFHGWATVVGDPAPFGAGVRFTVQIEGERFDSWLYGPAKHHVASRQSGELVFVQGNREPLRAGDRRARLRHVVGRFELQFVGDWSSGSPLSRANTRVRGSLRRAAESAMQPDEAALFTGLVIGDDARQSPAMVVAFRASGLSHLTAVSGQNVTFVLAAAAPVLRRLRPWWRLFTTLGLIGWFMALTRFEPSILRAGVMAMLAASAFVLGLRQSPIRLLAIAVAALVLVDPLLVWSVGFWLSVGATAGVTAVGPWLAHRLPGPIWLRTPVAVTLGAQVGVLVPSWLVFHRLPLVSLPANLLAVPVAGFVMLYGIPAGLLAAAMPQPVAAAVMMPAVVGTRWVSTVALLAARLEPSSGWAWTGWAIIACGTLLAVGRSRGRRPTVPI